MLERILKEERIAVLWLGELLPDIDQIPAGLGQKIVIERASRPEVATQMDQPLYVIEKLKFGVTHMKVRAYILSLWNLSPEVVVAVLFNSFPNATGGTQFTPLTAVHIADSLLPDVLNVIECKINSRLSQSYVERLGLRDKRHAWDEEAAQYANQLYAAVGGGF